MTPAPLRRVAAAAACRHRRPHRGASDEAEPSGAPAQWLEHTQGRLFFGGEDFYWVILVSSQSRVFQPVVSCVLVYILLSLTLLEVMIEILFRPRAERLGTHS